MEKKNLLKKRVFSNISLLHNWEIQETIKLKRRKGTKGMIISDIHILEGVQVIIG